MNRFYRTLTLGASLIVIAANTIPAHAALGDSVVWDFNLPATGDPSLDPAYPSVARLTLVDTEDGVQFTLDPNEANLGYASNSTVDALNITYSSSSTSKGLVDDLPSSTYRCDSGVCADADTFPGSLVAVVPPPGNAPNMDAGYTSDAGQLKLEWGNPDFNVTGISVWTILGATIADNFSAMATANNKATPVFGIFSVSPISQFPDGPVPNPSNWVTGPSPVPIPAAAWLFGSGLIGLAGIARKRKAS